MTGDLQYMTFLLVKTLVVDIVLVINSVANSDSLNPNPDPDQAFQVNPDPDPGPLLNPDSIWIRNVGYKYLVTLITLLWL
jgi:hypothetical protein